MFLLMHMADWTPSQEGTEYELTPTLQGIKKYRESFNALMGLTLDGARAHGDGGGDHARSVAGIFHRSASSKVHRADIQNGVSIDQVTAEQVGKATRFSLLELGLEASAQAGNCDSGYSCAYASNMSWRGPTNPVAKEIDPGVVFDRLFAGQTSKETPARAKTTAKKYRKSVLDFVLEDAKPYTESYRQISASSMNTLLAS